MKQLLLFCDVYQAQIHWVGKKQNCF